MLHSFTTFAKLGCEMLSLYVALVCNTKLFPQKTEPQPTELVKRYGHLSQ
jgi:hypothetical protein